MCRRYTTGLLLLACAALVAGYKTGAPSEVCGDMTPQHGVPPQTSRAPYRIKLSRNRIKPGDSVDVTISGAGNEGFKGFMIEARVGSTPIGRFSAGKDAKTVDCGSAKQNAVTHSGPELKKSVKVTWTAPRDLKERVVFLVTVAKDGGHFWVGLQSEAVNVS